MLDDAAISARRISADDAEISSTYKRGVWQCHYCVKRFSQEATFMRHTCEQKRRAQEIIHPTGQAAFGYYNMWLKHKKFKAQTIDAFMQARYYRAFLKFAQMVVAAGISKPERYVKLMSEMDNITPDLWCREQSYRVYLDWMDKQEDPLSQVQSSIICLMDIGEKESIDYTKVVEHIGPQRMLVLITQRKLSPWFLLHSSSVQTLLKTLDPEQLKAFDQAINISAWVERLEEHHHLRKDILQIIKEVGL